MPVSEKNAKEASANARIERVAHPSPMSDGHSGPVGLDAERVACGRRDAQQNAASVAGVAARACRARSWPSAVSSTTRSSTSPRASRAATTLAAAPPRSEQAAASRMASRIAWSSAPLIAQPRPPPALLKPTDPLPRQPRASTSAGLPMPPVPLSSVCRLRQSRLTRAARDHIVSVSATLFRLHQRHRFSLTLNFLD